MNPEDLLKPLSELTEREREVLRQRLSKLSKRQREVLPVFCDILSSITPGENLYATLGEKLYLAESTVKTHVGHICTKLGIDGLHPIQQKIVLHQVYCPLFREVELPPAPPDEADEPKPLPESVMRMVEELEKAFVSREQTPPVTVVEPQPAPRPKRLRLLLLVGVVLGFLLIAGIICAFGGFLWIRGLPMVVVTATSSGQETEAPVVEYGQVTREVTVEVTSTLVPPQPTPTPEEVVVVATATPEDTPTPVPPTPTSVPTNTPVPPTPTPLPTPTVTKNTPPGSILEEGESWQQNDVRLRLDRAHLDAPRECVTLMFNLFNDTDHTMVVTINSQNLSVVDNLDRKWRFSSIGFCLYGCSGRDEEIVDTVEAGERFRTEGCDTWKASFHAFLTDTNVNEIIVTVSGLPEISNARWRIPIYN